jgi:hypothetical protein
MPRPDPNRRTHVTDTGRMMTVLPLRDGSFNITIGTTKRSGETHFLPAGEVARLFAPVGD